MNKEILTLTVGVMAKYFVRVQENQAQVLTQL